MRVLSADEHRALDETTLDAHGINSAELMERAATVWTDRFVAHYPDQDRPIAIFAGSGNNGGDGLVIARLLRERGYTLRQTVTARVGNPSPDNQTNEGRARERGVPLAELKKGDPLPEVPSNGIVIDALFGTGLSRPVEGYWARLITHLNDLDIHRVAVDLPSGLVADEPSTGAVIRAHRTLSLGYPKLALFSPANTRYLGHWELVEFPLGPPPSPHGPEEIMLTAPSVRGLLKERYANDHKGTFGHALLVAGSFGKMGAAVISARGVLRAGAGLLTCHLPRSGYEIMQISLPEAMCEIDEHRYQFTELSRPPANYDTIGVGPGLGQDGTTRKGLFSIFERFDKPMVVDADALNLLATDERGIKRLPEGSILTPHPKEFERLFGKTDNDFARWRLLRERAVESGMTVLLKTGYTAIATPDGTIYFNTTGNPGMATGGTGDALTGILTGLLAQGYTPGEAARLGVYLHSLAGDIAARRRGREALLAGDVIDDLGEAFRSLKT